MVILVISTWYQVCTRYPALLLYGGMYVHMYECIYIYARYVLSYTAMETWRVSCFTYFSPDTARQQALTPKNVCLLRVLMCEVCRVMLCPMRLIIESLPVRAA